MRQRVLQQRAQQPQDAVQQGARQRSPAVGKLHLPALRQSAAKKQPLVPYFAVAFIPAYFL